jgi:hypothetical protein
MRFAVMMVLVTLSTSAVAEWIYVGENTTAGVTVYADPATIRRSGHIVRMWDLFDHKTEVVEGDNRFLSQKGQQEYDCKEERTRPIYFISYAGNMANGKVVYTNDASPAKWRPVSPGTLSEAIWKFACGKK